MADVHEASERGRVLAPTVWASTAQHIAETEDKVARPTTPWLRIIRIEPKPSTREPAPRETTPPRSGKWRSGSSPAPSHS